MKRTLVSGAFALLLMGAIGSLLWPVAEETPEDPATFVGTASNSPTSLRDEMEPQSISLGEAITPVPFSREQTPAAHHRGFKIRVVRQGDLSPVPHAELYALDQAMHGDALLNAQSTKSSTAYVRRHGLRYDCDSQGTLRSPDLEGPFILVAACGEAMGIWRSNWSLHGTEVATIPIFDPKRIRVRCADYEDQTIAGMGVVAISSTGVSVASTRTDAEGLATLTLSGLFRAHNQSEPLWILPSIVADPPIMEIVRSHDLPSTLRFALPPSGSVSVAIKRSDGSRYRKAFGAVLTAGGDPKSSSRYPKLPTREAENGELLFPHVQRGVRLRAEVSFPDEAERHPVIITGQGPDRALETVVLEGFLGAPLPVVTGRLCGADGQPLRSTSIHLTLTLRDGDVIRYSSAWDDLPSFDRVLAASGALPPQPKRSSKLTTMETDSKGRFRQVVHHPPLGEDLSRRLRFVRLIPGHDAIQRLGVDLDKTLAPGENDLGDLRLRSIDPLATGMVRSTSGRPIGGVSVIPLHRVDSKGWRPLAPLIKGIGMITDPRGRFVIHGEHEASTVRLHVTKGGYLGQSRDIPCGTSGVEFRLTKTSSFYCLVRMKGKAPIGNLLAAAPIDDLLVALIPREKNSRQWGGNPLRDDGSYHRIGVTPGRYDFLVSHRTLARIIHKVDDIEIAEGQSVDLGVIDVDCQLRQLDVEVVDRAGDPIFTGKARVRSAGQKKRRSIDLMNGRATFRVGSDLVDLEISAQGYRTKRIANPPDRLRVVLEPSPKVILIVTNPEDIPSDFSLRFQSTFSGIRPHGGLPGRLGGSPFNRPDNGASGSKLGPGEFTLSVANHGRHTASFWLETTEGGGMAGVLTVEVDVRDVEGVQRIPITFDRAKIREIVTSARGQ